MSDQQYYSPTAQAFATTDELAFATTPSAKRSLDRIKSVCSIAVVWLLLVFAMLAMYWVGKDVNINTDQGLINTLVLWVALFGLYVMGAVALLGTIISAALWLYPRASKISSFVTVTIQGCLFAVQCIPFGFVFVEGM